MMEYYYHKGSSNGNGNVVDVDVDDNNGCKIMAAINCETPKLGFTYPNGFQCTSQSCCSCCRIPLYLYLLFIFTYTHTLTNLSARLSLVISPNHST